MRCASIKRPLSAAFAFARQQTHVRRVDRHHIFFSRHFSFFMLLLVPLALLFEKIGTLQDTKRIGWAFIAGAEGEVTVVRKSKRSLLVDWKTAQLFWGTCREEQYRFWLFESS
jgi:hypothetical protein